jgi:hypothetical protein
VLQQVLITRLTITNPVLFLVLACRPEQVNLNDLGLAGRRSLSLGQSLDSAQRSKRFAAPRDDSAARGERGLLPPPPLDPPEERGREWVESSSAGRPTEGTAALPSGSVSGRDPARAFRRTHRVTPAVQVSFTDFLPGVFARLRLHFGIATDAYVEEWSGAAKIKLNEGGASQAFFFYRYGRRQGCEVCVGVCT